MNHRLNLYPKLHKNILDHELKHKIGGFKYRDLVHDMKSKAPGLFKFMFNHISSWTQILPFYYSRKKGMIIYDISATISWVFIIGIAWGIFKFFGWLFL